MLSADVLIVGSGPAAVSATWPLVEAGLKVTMLDSGDRAPPPAPPSNLAELRQSGDFWRYAFGDDLRGLRSPADRSPKFATRIAQHALAAEGDPPRIRTTGFRAVRSHTAGGLSTVWGAFVATFDDHDLREFPIGAADLAPSYAAVASRIGLSGGDDRSRRFHALDLALQPPSWLSPLARRVLDRDSVAPPRPGFVLGTAYNAVLTEAADDRQACNQCGLCLYGCARGAIYDSTQELARLRRFANFSYIGGTRVSRLLSVDGPWKEAELATRDGTSAAGARALVLAAGTVNSSALVLGHKAAIGRKVPLLTNPVAAMAFVFPGELGRPRAERGFALGQLGYRLALDKISDEAAGVLYTADSLPLSALAANLPLSRPAALRFAAFAAGALMLATIYLPGRFSRNNLSLDPDGDDLHIIGDNPDETKRLLQLSARRLSRAMRPLGAVSVPGSLAIPPPGTDGHLAGTLPMRQEGGDLTTTPNCEIRPWRDVFVVDGSCLSALPAKHCTLTIMANADRVGRLLARRLTHPEAIHRADAD